jgi:2-keto-4-pentenoate hydratase/2-oxohepta-3-ene-1,7-dioic acid hydratase in catechol pathway
MKHPVRPLLSGDVVEIEIPGIGTLRNRFVAEQRQYTI